APAAAGRAQRPGSPGHGGALAVDAYEGLVQLAEDEPLRGLARHGDVDGIYGIRERYRDGRPAAAAARVEETCGTGGSGGGGGGGGGRRRRGARRAGAGAREHRSDKSGLSGHMMKG